MREARRRHTLPLRFTLVCMWAASTWGLRRRAVPSGGAAPAWPRGLGRRAVGRPPWAPPGKERGAQATPGPARLGSWRRRCGFERGSDGESRTGSRRTPADRSVPPGPVVPKRTRGIELAFLEEHVFARAQAADHLQGLVPRPTAVHRRQDSYDHPGARAVHARRVPGYAVALAVFLCGAGGGVGGHVAGAGGRGRRGWRALPAAGGEYPTVERDGFRRAGHRRAVKRRPPWTRRYPEPAEGTASGTPGWAPAPGG